MQFDRSSIAQMLDEDSASEFTALVSTYRQQLMTLIGRNQKKEFFAELKREPAALLVLDFETLQHTALTQFAEPLLEYKELRDLIDTREKFKVLCFQFNIYLTLQLLKDPRIRSMAMPLLKHAAFYDAHYKFPKFSPQKIMQSRGLVALDLSSRLLPMSQRTQVMDAMQAAGYLAVKKKVLATFPTQKCYVDQMMFGEQGYYFSGRVDFSKDFPTFALDKKGFVLAAAFANQIYHARLKLLTSKRITQEDRFHVLECGAGLGTLCANIFEIIGKMSKLDESWLALYNTLQYNIVEISPELIKRQQKTTEKYKGKIKIQCGDARKLAELFPKETIAVAVSNELVDELIPDVVCEKEGRFVIPQVVPVVWGEDIKDLITSAELSAIRQESRYFEKMLTSISAVSGRLPSDGTVLLSGETFFRLHSLNLQKSLSSPIPFKFMRMDVVDTDLSPRIKDFMAENPALCASAKQGPYRHLPIDASEYLKGLQLILMPQGEVVTVDYAHEFPHEMDYMQAFDYSEKKDARASIFDKPGRIDISANVNMTHLAETRGYQTLFYGKQEQLSLDVFPSSVLSEEDKQAYLQKSSDSRFYVLVQRKLDADQKSTLEIKENPQRFKGNSKPVTYAQLKEVNRAALFAIADYPHQQLYTEAKNLCEGKGKGYEPYVEDIKNKKYGSALRKAAAVGSLPLVTLVLKYKECLAQGFDINETSSNGWSAWDWASKAPEAARQKIRAELVKFGAMPSPSTATVVSSAAPNKR